MSDLAKDIMDVNRALDLQNRKSHLVLNRWASEMNQKKVAFSRTHPNKTASTINKYEAKN